MFIDILFKIEFVLHVELLFSPLNKYKKCWNLQDSLSNLLSSAFLKIFSISMVCIGFNNVSVVIAFLSFSLEHFFDASSSKQSVHLANQPI